VTYGSMAGDVLDFTIVREGVEISIPVTLEISAGNAVDLPTG